MTSSTLCTQLVVTDLIVCSFPRLPFPGTRASTSKIWRRVEKDLYLHGSQQEAWLYLALVEPKELAAEDLWVTDIHVGRQPPSAIDGQQWESRHCGIWLLRQRCSGTVDQAVTDVAVLYGTDAVDPRPQWTLLLPALQLVDPPSDVPIARLSVHHGAALPIPLPDLQVRSDGTFKILQISDAHMVAGVGVCIDAIDAKGEYLPNCEADPLTARFMEAVLDIEQPDLVVLTGDQIHHDTLDSQTALFKVTAPMIRRHIPFTAVFGNHDDEGRYALSREKQMSILQSLPFSLCQPGPPGIDGVGNFCLDIKNRAPPHKAVCTLFFLDSHGQVPSKVRSPDYQPIKQSQIDWFREACQRPRVVSEGSGTTHRSHLKLVFQHIPIPEFEDPCLVIHSGQRREPSEGPSANSRFYDALVQEGVTAFACGHDHVNDFCALLPGDAMPWLCYGGGSGFGGYCSYDDERFYRSVRCWSMDTQKGNLETWSRHEHGNERVNLITLVERGKILSRMGDKGDDGCIVTI